MVQKLHIIDLRMLQVMDFIVKNKVDGITSQTMWCEKIGALQNNIFNIRKGMQRFTVDQVFNTCHLFKINSEFIFGFSNEMIRNYQDTHPLDRIKAAVSELENQQKTKTVNITLKKKTG